MAGTNATFTIQVNTPAPLPDYDGCPCCDCCGCTCEYDDEQ